MKKIEDNNTLVFIVDVRASKKKIKEAVKGMYDIQCAKVNTLIRPDGQKKAYVRLTPDYDALDVANKIGACALSSVWRLRCVAVLHMYARADARAAAATCRRDLSGSLCGVAAAGAAAGGWGGCRELQRRRRQQAMLAPGECRPARAHTRQRARRTARGCGAQPGGFGRSVACHARGTRAPCSCTCFRLHAGHPGHRKVRLCSTFCCHVIKSTQLPPSLRLSAPLRTTASLCTCARRLTRLA